MCEYHLKGQCFHPQKARKGTVAVACMFHSCNECTNKKWQEEKIEADLAYYQSVIELAQINQTPEVEQKEQPLPRKPLLTKIFTSN